MLMQHIYREFLCDSWDRICQSIKRISCLCNDFLSLFCVRACARARLLLECGFAGRAHASLCLAPYSAGREAGILTEWYGHRRQRPQTRSSPFKQGLMIDNSFNQLSWRGGSGRTHVLLQLKQSAWVTVTVELNISRRTGAADTQGIYRGRAGMYEDFLNILIQLYTFN